MSIFCLTGLLLDLFLVIPVFASWILFYAHVGASQNMHLGKTQTTATMKNSF